MQNDHIAQLIAKALELQDEFTIDHITITKIKSNAVYITYNGKHYEILVRTIIGNPCNTLLPSPPPPTSSTPPPPRPSHTPSSP